MNRNSPILVGLDVGTSKVACVIAAVESDSVEPSVLGVGISVNHGMRRGSVVDIDETVVAISQAVDEAERISGRSIEKASIGVGGVNIKSLNSKGVIAVGGMQHTITHDDVVRVEDAATVIQLPPNREILQVFSQQFRLDGQENIKDPVGMAGVRLEVDAHVVTAATPSLKNLQRAVYQSGLSIGHQSITSLAAAQAILDKRQREAGTVLVDIGAGTCSVAIFEEGEVLHTAVLPFGSGSVTNDLAIGLRTDLDTAETIKVKFANVGERPKNHGASVKTAAGELLHLDMGEVYHIVQARLEELFDQVDKELIRVNRSAKLPGGVVLTGGGSKLRGIEKVARDSLRLPVTHGKASGFGGIIDRASDPGLSVAVGLMLSGFSQSGSSTPAALGRQAKNVLSQARRLWDKIKP